MTLIYIKRWKGNRVHLGRHEKTKTGIDIIKSSNDIAVFVGIAPYHAGLQIRIPDRVQHAWLHLKWSGPGMAVSDFGDDCRFRLREWRYG